MSKRKYKRVWIKPFYRFKIIRTNYGGYVTQERVKGHWRKIPIKNSKIDTWKDPDAAYKRAKKTLNKLRRKNI